MKKNNESLSFLDDIFKKINDTRILFRIFFWTALTVAAIFLAVFITIGFADKIFQRNLCFEKECFDNFLDSFSPAFQILEGSIKYVLFVANILGVIIALNAYKENAKSNYLSTHLAHYSAFEKYILNQIESLPRIDKKTVDINFLYSYIFPESRDGKFNASVQYTTFIISLAQFIAGEEKMFHGDMATMAPFKNHQNSTNEKLRALDIKIPLKPNKGDFFKVEHDIYHLLNNINSCFCKDMEKLPDPNYCSR